MAPLPLAARVVKVIADRGAATAPRYLHASGCLVAGRMVRTPAHVVAGAIGIRVRDPNSKIRLISHCAFGFHSPDPLIALVYLCCAGITIELPR